MSSSSNSLLFAKWCVFLKLDLTVLIPQNYYSINQDYCLPASGICVWKLVYVLHINAQTLGWVSIHICEDVYTDYWCSSVCV